MSLSRNLVAGMTSSIWTALVGLAVVPLYLNYLGIEAYGLVGFLATLQSIFSLLDLGLSTTINRETARFSASGNLNEAGKLLHTLAVIYWSMAAVIALFVVLTSSFIAGHWLNATHIPNETIIHAVMMMGFIIACRWPIGLYQGALMGAQRLTISSSVNIAMPTIGSLGAVGILAFVSPTIQALFIWQAVTGLIYALTMRRAAWGIIGRKAIRFEIDALRRTWHFSMGISAITVTALIFIQLDKVILSKTLKLEDFGRYMLATNIVSGLYSIIMPVYNVIYPHFSALVSSGEHEKLGALYRSGTRFLASILFPIAATLAIFSMNLVKIWTGNPELASDVAPLIALLAIGSALHGVMFFPYALQLAHGMTRLPIKINAILMIIQVPLIISLSLSYGALGGAIAWLVLHVLYVLLGTWLTHRELLKKTGQIWLFSDVGIPLALSLIAGCFEYYLNKLAGYPDYMKLFFGGMSTLLAIFCSFAISHQMRSILPGYAGRQTKHLTGERTTDNRR